MRSSSIEFQEAPPDRDIFRGIRHQFVSYRASFFREELVKKARKTWPRNPDQSQRRDTTLFLCFPFLVANDLFRRASRIRYQRLFGPPAQATTTLLLCVWLCPVARCRGGRNHECKGGVARTTRGHPVLFVCFVAGRSF